MDIAALRKSYEKDELDEAASAADPLQQFQRWFDQALAGQLPEPNAMTLATVAEGGRPSTRVVLIKGVDARGLVWYTNYDSRKGRELAQRPVAAELDECRAPHPGRRQPIHRHHERSDCLQLRKCSQPNAEPVMCSDRRGYPETGTPQTRRTGGELCS